MTGERIAALLGSIWLLFLGFPIAELLRGDYSTGQKVLGLVLVTAFAATYLWGYSRSTRTSSSNELWTRVEPGVVGYLAVAVALAAGLAAIIGINALGLTSFLIAASMFALPIAWSWGFSIVVLAATVVLPLLAGALGDWAFMVVINLAIAVGMGISRYYAELAEAEMHLERQRAVVVERERVSRDVHDVLGHSLTVIALKTELADRLLDADPKRARAELREANTLAREAIADVRATVGGLRVRQIAEELGHARETLAHAGLTVTVSGDPETVDPRHRIVLAWALREATTNILRHAGATAARVEVGPRRLVVEDDGGGLGESPAGNGLRGLRERVEDAGGTMELGTSVDLGGTRLEVTL